MNHCLSTEDVRRLRKLEQALKELKQRQNTYFSITKISSIKSLCKDDYRRVEYCVYLSNLAIINAKNHADKEESKQIANLLQDGQHAIIGVADQYKKYKNEKVARETLFRLKDFQDEKRKVKWATVRVIKNTNLLILENILQALLSQTDSASVYVYQATKHYVERYNPQYGTGLIIDSIPMLEEVIRFWKGFECTK